MNSKPTTLLANVATVFDEVAAIVLMNSRNIDQLKLQKADLEETLGQIRTLEIVLPICSHCKSIRQNDGALVQVDAYIAMQTDTMCSHGICPDCIKKFYPE